MDFGWFWMILDDVWNLFWVTGRTAWVSVGGNDFFLKACTQDASELNVIQTNIAKVWAGIFATMRWEKNNMVHLSFFKMRAQRKSKISKNGSIFEHFWWHVFFKSGMNFVMQLGWGGGSAARPRSWHQDCADGVLRAQWTSDLAALPCLFGDQGSGTSELGSAAGWSCDKSSIYVVVYVFFLCFGGWLTSKKIFFCEFKPVGFSCTGFQLSSRGRVLPKRRTWNTWMCPMWWEAISLHGVMQSTTGKLSRSVAVRHWASLAYC